MDVKEILMGRLGNDKESLSSFYRFAKSTTIVFLIFSAVYPIAQYLMELGFGNDYNAPFFMTAEVLLCILWCVLSYFVVLHLEKQNAEHLVKKMRVIIIAKLILLFYSLLFYFGFFSEFLISSFILKCIIAAIILVLELKVGYMIKNYKKDDIGGLIEFGNYWIFASIIWFLYITKNLYFILAYDFDLAFQIVALALKVLIVLQVISAIIYSKALYKIFDIAQKQTEQ